MTRAAKDWPVRALRSTGALLKLGYTCNDACRFCHSAPHRGTDLSTAAARARVRAVAAAGVERVVFSGGEPTLRPDVVALTRYARSLGLAVGVVTNGRMLAYPKLRQELLAAGLSQVYLSLHSHRARVHDDLVRAEAHRQTVAAARALAHAPGVELAINCVLVGPNLGDTRGLVRLVMGLGGGPRALKLSFVEPEGNTLDDFDALVPELREAARRVAGTLCALDEPARAAGVTLGVDGFPPCVLEEARTRTSDLWTEGFVYLSEAFERRLHPVDEHHKARGEPCRRCALDGCPGVYRTYLARRGDAELTPFSSPRGSAVDFVDQGPVARFDVRRCPSLAGRRPHPDPRRELLVAGRGRVRLHRADATDFDERELARLTGPWQQVYREVPGARGRTDFARTLRKLRPSASCDRCPHRECCGRVWVAERADVLAADERRLRQALGGLRGRILDVGCGAAAYLSDLADAAQGGRVELHGLDPDPAAAEAVAALAAPMAFQAVALEDFANPGAPFDHVLAVRSWSHLPDVDRSAERVAALLRRGGRWTIVGDTPVAMVRGRSAVRRSRADRSLPLEHYRNHGARDAWELLRRHPFRRVRIVEPEPAASNLWWLVLERQ